MKIRANLINLLKSIQSINGQFNNNLLIKVEILRTLKSGLYMAKVGEKTMELKADNINLKGSYFANIKEKDMIEIFNLIPYPKLFELLDHSSIKTFKADKNLLNQLLNQMSVEEHRDNFLLLNFFLSSFMEHDIHHFMINEGNKKSLIQFKLRKDESNTLDFCFISTHLGILNGLIYMDKGFNYLKIISSNQDIASLLHLHKLKLKRFKEIDISFNANTYLLQDFLLETFI